MTVNLRLYVLIQGCTIKKSKRKIGIQAKILKIGIELGNTLY